VKARQEAGGRRQEKNNYGIKTGFSIRPDQGGLAETPDEPWVFLKL
jgi:hypothetical protein